MIPMSRVLVLHHLIRLDTTRKTARRVFKIDLYHLPRHRLQSLRISTLPIHKLVPGVCRVFYFIQFNGCSTGFILVQEEHMSIITIHYVKMGAGMTNICAPGNARKVQHQRGIITRTTTVESELVKNKELLTMSMISTTKT